MRLTLQKLSALDQLSHRVQIYNCRSLESRYLSQNFVLCKINKWRNIFSSSATYYDYKGFWFSTFLIKFCIRHHAHLKDLKKSCHVDFADTKRDSKYSWHNCKDNQESEPHGDGDAKISAQQTVSRKCKPCHAVQQEKKTAKRWYTKGLYEASVCRLEAEIHIKSELMSVYNIKTTQK